VARAEDTDNPVYAQLIEIYQSPEVLDQLAEENAGTAITQVIDPAELQQDLADLEGLVRDNA
jgi:D-methionine transport system substrate-binding protein